MKKHLLAAFAFLACAFSSSAFASTTLEGWRQGVSAEGNKVWFGPGYQARTAQMQGKAIWDSAIGNKGSSSATAFKPTQPVTVRPMSVGKGLVVASKIAVPIGGMLAVMEVDNAVTNAALVGAVTGLVTGGPGNAVFMGATSALMAWGLQGEGISKNPSFPDSQTTHPFLRADETTMCSLTSAENASISSQLAPLNGTCYGNATCSASSVLTVVPQGGGVYMCVWRAEGKWTKPSGDSGVISQYLLSKAPTAGAISKPATWPEIVDKLGNIVPEPKTLQEALDFGAHPDMTTTVSGPATGEGPKETTTSTTKNPDGTPATTTTTTSTVNNYTYNNNVVTYNTSTNTTTTNPDGSKDTDVTIKEPGKDEKPESPPTDSPLGPVPDLYERQYPDGMEGVWNTYKDQLKNTSLGSLAAKLMPNIPDGGTCPSWPINLDLAQWATFGTHDVAPPCYIWGVAKAILIVSALLLARALVFGG